MVNLEKIILIVDFIGSLLIAYAALRVHHRFLHEKKVDEEVFRVMKKEQIIGYGGVLFVTAAFLLELFKDVL